MLGLAALLAAQAVAAEPVPVRFVEGVSHGFLTLRTADAAQIATGDLLQFVRRGEVESRMVFIFKDGSVLDETVVFTQQRVFAMKTYRLLQKGPAFAEDTEISLERASGKYRVKTTARKDGRVDLLEGVLEMPADTYNGMVLTVTKNLAKGASETIHVVAFTPAARLVPVELAPAGEQKITVGTLTKSATRYVFKAKPGPWLSVLASVLGRMPPDSHAWVLTEDVPAFVKFEGPLHPAGAPWRIELTSPRWPD
ncbi:MAG TPA: hypothetical protein VNC62_07685 [Burkholderiales bacterium]|nr:hypothetical protein [Burkholderiales bacterium]